MKKIFYIPILLLLVTSCNENDDATYPTCIDSSIEQYYIIYPTPPITGIKASIKKYSYRGEIVYFVDFQPGFADGIQVVINENCEFICHFGGIAGTADPKHCGIDWQNATYIETVWIDPR